MRVQVRFFTFLVIQLLFLSKQTFPQANTSEGKIRFNHLTKEDGLSDSFDWCILKDSKGFMWIGTSDGLDRYDGRGFKSYKYSPEDVNSLGANTIRALYEDKSGILWIGTEGGGLNRYNSAQENFTRFTYDLTCPQKSDPIIKLGSKEKKIWVKSDSQASRS